MAKLTIFDGKPQPLNLFRFFTLTNKKIQGGVKSLKKETEGGKIC
mgnify:CR=1 FL=1